jgi:predicted nucleic acid-binding protein
MPQRFFLDTNILVYSFDDRFPAKQVGARKLIETALDGQNGMISYQVVQECLHLMLSKFERKMAFGQAEEFLAAVLMPLCKVFPDRSLFDSALAISAQTGWTFYDSLIVSGAVAAGCDVLLTEDLQQDRVIRGVKIRNPFA